MSTRLSPWSCPPARRVRAAAALSLLSVAACGSDGTAPSAPAPLPPLASATWHVHEAEGQPLPALVAHRLEQGALVQDFLDSARVQVEASGRWTRSLWLSRYRAGLFETRVTGLEHGTWRADEAAYVFTAEGSGRTFTLATLTPGQVVRLPLRDAREGYIEATVRTVPPEAPIAGTYRVTQVRGADVPAAMHVFNDYPEDGRLLSIHYVVDSMRLVLRGNQRYEHVIHYAEWDGPNHGPPTRLRRRAVHQDFGVWQRDGTLLRFESAWWQNLRFAGTTYGPQAMELLHGLAHGDVAVPVRYARTAPVD